jgi:hypothetical protein
MEEVYYKKIGNKYVAVSYYNHDVMDSIPLGSHLIIKSKGSTSRRNNITPAFAPMIAAGYYAESAIVESIVKASELRPTNKMPLTPKQADAWNMLAEAFGTETHALTYGSYQDAAIAGVKAMTDEANKLLEHPTVRAAYDHFLLTCELVHA